MWEKRGWGQPAGDTGHLGRWPSGAPARLRPLGGASRVRPHLRGRGLSSLGFIEVFAQACAFPNKQTRVNWGVEQGLGLPAVPSGWVREEPRSSFPVPSVSCPRGFALLALLPPLPCTSGVTCVQPPSKFVPQIGCFLTHYCCARVRAALLAPLAEPHRIYIPGKASLTHPRPSPAHQGSTQSRLVPLVLGKPWSSLDQWEEVEWDEL